MRNIDILSTANAYRTQRQNGEGIKLPAKAAWILRVNMDKINHYAGVIEEALKEVGQKYSDDEHSTPMKDGNGRNVKPEFLAEFAKEQGDLLTQETDVDIRKIKIEDLGDIELSYTDMDALAFMIEE